MYQPPRRHFPVGWQMSPLVEGDHIAFYPFYSAHNCLYESSVQAMLCETISPKMPLLARKGHRLHRATQCLRRILKDAIPVAHEELPVRVHREAPSQLREAAAVGGPVEGCGLAATGRNVCLDAKPNLRATEILARRNTASALSRPAISCTKVEPRDVLQLVGRAVASNSDPSLLVAEQGQPSAIAVSHS